MGFWYSAYTNIQVTIVYAKQLLIIYLFVFLSSEEREWMMIIVYEENETIKKIFFNEIEYRIDNHMWMFWKMVR